MRYPVFTRPKAAATKVDDVRDLPADTPDEVVAHIAAHPKGKPPTVAPDLGVPLDPDLAAERARARREMYPRGTGRHALVTIGDSVSQGVEHAAVKDTWRSCGALLAAELGISHKVANFQIGDGLPVNLEGIARAVTQHAAPDLPLRDLPRAGLAVYRYLRANTRAWVRGPGRLRPYTATPGVQLDSLTMSGFDLLDAMVRTEFTERNGITGTHPRRLNPLVPSGYRRATARTMSYVHDEFGVPVSLVDGADVLGRNGGIDTLVVALGANNVLGSVRTFQIKWSGDDHTNLDAKDAYNVWTPEHFRESYDELVGRLKHVNAERIIFATVPHVTIAPFAHGIGGKVHPASRYFNYYVYPWVTEATFNPTIDPHLTAAEARAIDGAIDCYNQHIEDVVAAGRREGRDWYVVDLCTTLDELAPRRWDDIDRPTWLREPTLTDAIRDAGFTGARLMWEDDALTAGGYFGLDSIHPTSAGQAIIKEQVKAVMHRAGAAVTRRADGSMIPDQDAQWIATDSALTTPINGLSGIYARIAQANVLINRITHPIKAMRHTGELATEPTGVSR